MKFLKDFEKSVAKIEGVGGSSLPPRYWHSFGNYVLNKIMSGGLFRGIPQGRITGVVGPSGSGKSFICGNLVREAQKDGAFILVIDSENALDDEYMEKIGVDTTQNYMYKSVTTIPQVSQIVSTFLKGYKAEYGSDVNAPKVLVVIDSLSMLMTETELSNYESGDIKGDQGQLAKQTKAMLKTFVQDIKNLNVSMVVTGHVYKNQDVKNGEGVWIVNDGIKFSLSQILLVTKLRLKGEKAGEFEGIEMRCNSYKTRFAKPFQTVEIQVPYETGIDPYSGLIETAVALNIIARSGSRYSIVGKDESWYSKDIAQYAEEIMKQIDEKDGAYISVISDAEEEALKAPSMKQQRIEKAQTLLTENDDATA